MSDRLAALQNEFYAATTEADRNQIRHEIHELGFTGVAASIGYPDEEQKSRADAAFFAKQRRVKR